MGLCLFYTSFNLISNLAGRKSLLFVQIKTKNLIKKEQFTLFILFLNLNKLCQWKVASLSDFIKLSHLSWFSRVNWNFKSVPGHPFLSQGQVFPGSKCLELHLGHFSLSAVSVLAFFGGGYGFILKICHCTYYLWTAPFSFWCLLKPSCPLSYSTGLQHTVLCSTLSRWNYHGNCY